MIVYKCKSKWVIFATRRRTVKMRVSDKNVRWYEQFHRRRGGRYWYKSVDSDN